MKTIDDLINHCKNITIKGSEKEIMPEFLESDSGITIDAKGMSVHDVYKYLKYEWLREVGIRPDRQGKITQINNNE